MWLLKSQFDQSHPSGDFKSHFNFFMDT